ncbi:MAG: DUF4224 domain-containing protein [Sulfuriferula sp.]
MLFLEPSELRILTGMAQKSKQVDQLRRMGVPFFLNAAGHPIVTRAAVEGNIKPQQHVEQQAWRPAVLGA